MSSVMMKEVSEVLRRLLAEDFVGEDQDFELDEVGDREPVKTLENRVDVVSGTGEESCSRALKVLEIIEDSG